MRGSLQGGPHANAAGALSIPLYSGPRASPTAGSSSTVHGLACRTCPGPQKRTPRACGAATTRSCPRHQSQRAHIPHPRWPTPSWACLRAQEVQAQGRARSRGSQVWPSSILRGCRAAGSPRARPPKVGQHSAGCFPPGKRFRRAVRYSPEPESGGGGGLGLGGWKNSASCGSKTNAASSLTPHPCARSFWSPPPLPPGSTVMPVVSMSRGVRVRWPGSTRAC
jgi:hypothetical protein